jgi:ADP-ribose pyrophosphatase YjhB (NUDIX family)
MKLSTNRIKPKLKKILSPQERSGINRKDYEFIFKKVPRLCVDLLIVNNKKILLAKRDIKPFKGFWSLPGGMVCKHETIDEAIERIVGFELHQKPVSRELLGYMEFLKEPITNGVNFHSVSIAFLTKLKSYEVKGSFQAKELKFFSSLPKKVHPVHAKFIKQNWKNIIK